MPIIKDLVIQPRSAFLAVQCPKCGTEKILFSHTTREVRCENCGEVLTKPTGGKAVIYGKIIRRLD